MKDLTVNKGTFGLTSDQLSLVTSTVAKGATRDELQLFLYRCQNLDLDPLKPGQIHFVKYGNNPGSIIIGVDGFRARAAKTGKHTGTKRGIIRDDSGRCIGAWCEVYRSDWEHPARDEASLSEYNTGKNNWAKMPETMIKKVAEVAALRMAFPDELGGIYSDDEMEQAKDGLAGTVPDAKQTVKIVAPDANAHTITDTEILEIEADIKIIGEMVCPFPKHVGKRIRDFHPENLEKYITYIQDQWIRLKGEPSKDKKEFVDAAKIWLQEQRNGGSN